MRRLLPSPSRLACALVAAALAATASSARAEPAPSAEVKERHTVAIHVEGAQRADVEAALRAALPPNLDYVPADALQAALTKAGQKTPFGLVLTLEDRRRAPTVQRIGKALGALGAEALVVAQVRPRKGGVGKEAFLLVVEPGRDAPSVETTAALGTAEATREALATALAEPIEAWRPAPAPAATEEPTEAPEAAPAPAPSDASAEEAPGDRPRHVVGHEYVSVGLAFDLGGRFFGYHDGVGTNLRDYDVFGVPGVHAVVEVFPLTGLSTPVVSDLGVYGEARLALGLSSEAPDGTSVDTTWMRFGGGLRYRLPLGDADAPFVFGARGGLAHDAFRLDAQGDLGGEVPSVAYTFLRGGLDARLPLGPLALTLDAGYLGALDAGDVADRFRDTKLGGVELGGGLAVPLAAGFEIRAAAQYVRWFYAFAPVPGDAFVAGGALDEQLHMELGPAYVH